MTTNCDNRVTVVVTVRDDAAGMDELLSALAGQTRPPDEIVVVDGGSTDGTCDVLAKFDPGEIAYRWLQRAGANIAAGRNIAIAESTGEIIACTDSGCVPDSDWLEELTAPFADAEVTVVGGGYRVSARTDHERVLGLLTMPGELSPVDPLRFNPSARSLAFRRAAWERAGRFPEWLMTAEDTLFACRLRHAGERYVYAEQALVRWQPRRTLRSAWRQFRGYARGEAHIGRGYDTARFWTRRYALAGLCIAALALAVAAGRWGPALLAAFTAAGALIGPIHHRAAAVAERTSRWGDYPRAIGMSHWVTLATLRGHARGRRDRQRDPHTYVSRLRAYWGADAVTSAPPWNMPDPPAPRTLIVSWHWPPTNRASTNVLANLFAAAPPGVFQALARAMPGTEVDPVALPPPFAVRVPWMLPDDQERMLVTPMASAVSSLRMIAAARRMHRDTPFQRVMAVYPHRWSLLAGWLASRALGVPLVAYMHDLCAEGLITSNPLKRAFWTAVDRRALASAFLVMTPSREFALHYRSRGVLASWVLPHCNAAEVSAPRACACSDGVLRLVYAGNIYQAHEAAVRALLDALVGAERVRARFLCGPNRLVSNSEARWVDRASARAAMQAADVLAVCLSASTPYPREIQGCFPSKIVDYLAAGKPILAIVPGNTFVARLVRETGCGVVVDTQSPTDIAAALNGLRDAAVRAAMSAAARRLSGELDARRWMREMCVRLALGAPVDPSTPPFPPNPAAHAEPETTLAATLG